MAEILKTGYNNLSHRMIAEINRGEIFHLAFELYRPDEDEIFLYPERAVFRFSTSHFSWRNRTYLNKIKSIPELRKFIGKQFNTLAFGLANVVRNSNSGSAFVFNNLIRGFRVGVRIIFPNLGDCLQDTRLIWWGRVSHVEEVNETEVQVSCSQEIGNFSYKLGTDKFGSACPLWFGRGDCLGTELFTQKTLAYQEAFNTHGQGGCNRTKDRCKQLGNERFYQGQNVVTVTGNFIREEIVKKKILWIFTVKKKNRIPVQWSSKNQSENDDVAKPLVFGRARVILHAFTWADVGTTIIALMGASKGPIEGFYNITSHNPDLPLQEFTPHLGEYGGELTQQPDPRFPDSGYNSRLAYIGATFGNSTLEDSPEEVPDVTAVVKGTIVPVPLTLALTGGVAVPPVVIPPAPPVPPPTEPPVTPPTDLPGGGGDEPFPGGGGGGDYNKAPIEIIV